jgi:hypothetical protein
MMVSRAFYLDKCNVLFFTRNKTPVKYTYTLHGQHLEHADKAKYLAVTIQSDLKWDSHIYTILQEDTEDTKVVIRIRK